MDYLITEVNLTKAGVAVTFTPCDKECEEEKTELLIKLAFWKKEGLDVDSTVDEERLSALKNTAEVCRAIARAESMLSQSDYSRRRLISRLLHYKLSKEACEAAADHMIELGYINEKEQTARITKFYCQRKHWGKKRIAAELMGRGYDRDVISKAINTVGDDEYYNSLLKHVFETFREPAEDKNENDKRIASLVRLGHTVSDAIRALNEAEEMYLDSEK